jgi:ElaB/YqjD/DUF883 family membrane-anchored ribosome-binding protein
MRARLAIFASVVLCGNAAGAQTQYAVEGLPVGAKLNFDRASYREFKCNPSEQFDGLTWCQKTRTDAGRRGSSSTGYSLLHSTEGNVLYVNRSQEAAFSNQAEAQADIKRYSRAIGTSPQITTMPHRAGLPDGIIATWGGIALKPLDPQSIKILADGKSPKKGLLIDHLGDLARSAREGLPIYRIDGGPGFVWAASFGLRGRGTLRVVAADTNGLIALPPEQQPTGQSAAIPTAAEMNPPESGQSVEQLQTEITNLTSKIAELEKAAAIAAEVAASEAQARADAELSRRAIEQTAVTEKATLEGTIARLQADRAATDAKAGWRQSALPGTIGGLVGALTTCAVGFFVTRRKANASKQPVWEPGRGPIDLSAQSQIGAQEAVPHVSSPEIVGAETAVGLESGEKAAITPTPPVSTACIPAGERLEAAGEVSAPRPS